MPQEKAQRKAFFIISNPRTNSESGVLHSNNYDLQNIY